MLYHCLHVFVCDLYCVVFYRQNVLFCIPSTSYYVMLHYIFHIVSQNILNTIASYNMFVLFYYIVARGGVLYLFVRVHITVLLYYLYMEVCILRDILQLFHNTVWDYSVLHSGTSHCITRCCIIFVCFSCLILHWLCLLHAHFVVMSFA